MNKKTLQLCVAIFMLFGITSLQAQETIPVTGGNANGSGGSVSYTIGQTFYITNTGTNGSVAEGVQQPFEISVVIGIEEANGINLSVSAYPNPTTDLLQLKVESEKLKDLSFQLYDMQGKLLHSEKIVSNQTGIEMRNLVPATYFLKVIQGNKEVKEFKIIKN
jgi:hypothetical protein